MGINHSRCTCSQIGSNVSSKLLPTTHVFDQEGRWKESKVGYSPPISIKKIIKEQHADANQNIGKIIPVEYSYSQITYRFYPRSDIEDIISFDSQIWFVDTSQNIQKLELKNLTSNKSQSIASIQSKPISDYQLALANDLSCIGKGHTVHCSGERTWFQNTDEKIQNLYFEEDILYVESSSKILMYNRLGHFWEANTPIHFKNRLYNPPTRQQWKYYITMKIRYLIVLCYFQVWVCCL